MAVGGIEPPSLQLTVRRSTARPPLYSGIKPKYVKYIPYVNMLITHNFIVYIYRSTCKCSLTLCTTDCTVVERSTFYGFPIAVLRVGDTVELDPQLTWVVSGDSEPLEYDPADVFTEVLLLPEDRAGALVTVSQEHLSHRHGFMQDNIIASHTCFGGHMDVNC